MKARDRHCRFPGCARPAEYVDLDHVVPRDHDNPSAGGPTCVTNLVCLCRRHHRLKTHSPSWVFAMDPDGTLHVTPPGGRTRTTRPACIAEVDMSTSTSTDLLTDLLGPTPARFRTPTPEQRAARRTAASDRARLAAEIDAELDAALARLAAERAVTDREAMAVQASADEAVDPAAVDLAAVDLAAVDLAAVDTAAVDPAAVDPAAVDTAAVDTPAVDTPATDPTAVDDGPTVGHRASPPF